MHEENQVETAESNSLSPAWEDALSLPCRLSFGLGIRGFTLGDLIQLEVGSLIDSGREQSADVEVELNGRLIGWAEFEAVGAHLGFRLTDLA